ncbi:MAG: membrane protein insertion efficiency factor YidD [Flavobacteriaceae bacterium]
MKKFFSVPFIILIKIYQKIVSPALPASCRYNPTCSNYAIQSLKKHNFIKAIYLIFTRILRCHPWSKGGFDPVP